MNQPPNNIQVNLPLKSVGVSLVLTFFFGSFGLLYSSIVAGIIMFFVEVIVAIFTFGFGLILTHPICMVWGAIATNAYNKKMLEKYGK